MKNKANIIVLVDNGYQELEFWYPVIRMKESGYNVIKAGFEKKLYEGEYGYPVKTDSAVMDIDIESVTAVIIPGGVKSPDNMRRHEQIPEFVKKAYNNGAIIAAICHGPWIIVSAGIAKDKFMTSFPSIKDDIINAGAKYMDKPVVMHERIITVS